MLRYAPDVQTVGVFLQKVRLQRAALLECFAAVVAEVQPVIYLGEAILPLVVLLLADWGIGS